MENHTSDYRVEKDSIGTKDVPANVYYGVQSLRAAENFPITGLRMNPELIRSLAYIKKAAVTRDGVTYDVYTFVRNEPLKAGAMTEWNVWNFIGINKDATSADIQKAIDAGAITATDGTMTLNVLVEADAIQAEGFADAAAAWAAFK